MQCDIALFVLLTRELEGRLPFGDALSILTARCGGELGDFVSCGSSRRGVLSVFHVIFHIGKMYAED